jgi:hypothetical protein
VSLWGFGGQVVGAIGWNLPEVARRAREHVVARAPFTGPRDLVERLGDSIVLEGWRLAEYDRSNRNCAGPVYR